METSYEFALSKFDKCISYYSKFLFLFENQIEGKDVPIEKLTSIMHSYFFPGAIADDPLADAIQEIKNIAFLNGVGTERAIQYIENKIIFIYDKIVYVNENHLIIINEGKRHLEDLENSIKESDFWITYNKLSEENKKIANETDNEFELWVAYSTMTDTFYRFLNEVKEIVGIGNLAIPQPPPNKIDLPVIAPESSKANDMSFAATQTQIKKSKPNATLLKDYSHRQIAIAYKILG